MRLCALPHILLPFSIQKVHANCVPSALFESKTAFIASQSNFSKSEVLTSPRGSKHLGPHAVYLECPRQTVKMRSSVAR